LNQTLQDHLAALRALPALLPRLLADIEPRARLALSTPQLYGIRQIILTGCGDSYIAAMAAASAWRAWTGLPVYSLKAMDAGRYLTVGLVKPSDRLRGTLVIGVSHSGEAARAVEALQKTSAAGALTLALTARRESRLAQTATVTLPIDCSDAGNMPGTASYYASLVGLYLLGIRVAEVRMTLSMNAAAVLRQTLADLQPAVASSIELSEEPLRAAVRSWGAFHTADILGSGPGAASAAYGAAKLIEAAGVQANPQDIEEFFHLNYFVSQPARIPTVVYASARSAGASRTSELLRTLQEIGRPSLLITDDTSFGPADRTVTLPTVPELLSPLVSVVPAAVLAASWADHIGADYFRGHRGLWQSSRGGALIRDSVIEGPAENLA
jgi:glucosamine--fructose-6-phosphate aminotransferase (isomerizing)